MPIHDWTRVPAGTFHDFHLAWIAELRNSLNGGVLPPSYYAQAEQIVGPLEIDPSAIEPTVVISELPSPIPHTARDSRGHLGRD